MSNKNCWHGNKCKHQRCNFWHPRDSPCKFRGACSKRDCQYRHSCVHGDKCWIKQCQFRHTKISLESEKVSGNSPAREKVKSSSEQCVPEIDIKRSKMSSVDNTQSDDSQEVLKQKVTDNNTVSNSNRNDDPTDESKSKAITTAQYLTTFMGMFSAFVTGGKSTDAAVQQPDESTSSDTNNMLSPTHTECEVVPDVVEIPAASKEISSAVQQPDESTSSDTNNMLSPTHTECEVVPDVVEIPAASREISSAVQQPDESTSSDTNNMLSPTHTECEVVPDVVEIPAASKEISSAVQQPDESTSSDTNNMLSPTHTECEVVPDVVEIPAASREISSAVQQPDESTSSDTNNMLSPTHTECEVVPDVVEIPAASKEISSAVQQPDESTSSDTNNMLSPTHTECEVVPDVVEIPAASKEISSAVQQPDESTSSDTNNMLSPTHTECEVVPDVVEIPAASKEISSAVQQPAVVVQSAVLDKSAYLLWNCVYCNLQNDDKLRECSSCKTERPILCSIRKTSTTVKDVIDSTDWICTCTQKNTATVDVCVVCQVPRLSHSDSNNKERLCTSCQSQVVVDRDYCVSCEQVFSQVDSRVPSFIELNNQPENENNKWECDTCTLHNNINDTICSVCGSLSPKAKSEGGFDNRQPSEPEKPINWECQSCTYLNQLDELKCCICETESPLLPVSEPDDDIDEWTCAACTTLNCFAMLQCRACAEPAPLSVRLLNQNKPKEDNNVGIALGKQPKWSCHSCSFDNIGEHKVCEMCTSPSPEWVCGKCTFENPKGKTHCDACGEISEPSQCANDSNFAQEVYHQLERDAEEQKKLIEERDALLCFELTQEQEEEIKKIRSLDEGLARVIAEDAIQTRCRVCNVMCCVPKSYEGKSGVCLKDDCRKMYRLFCNTLLPCGHACSGSRDEQDHFECTKCNPQDDCFICMEPSGNFPSIALKCGHYVHKVCTQSSINNAGKLQPGTRIQIKTRLLQCPMCFDWLTHSSLDHLEEYQQAIDTMVTIGRNLYKKDNGQKKNRKSKNMTFADLTKIYSYYTCYDCKKPFIGGLNNCEPNADNENPDDDDNKPNEKVLCNHCHVDQSGNGIKCNLHPDDLLIKCDFCCTAASFRCGGGVYYCNNCHSHLRGVVDKCKGADCPLGGNHPQGRTHGYIIGCVGCRAANADANKWGGQVGL